MWGVHGIDNSFIITCYFIISLVELRIGRWLTESFALQNNLPADKPAENGIIYN